MAGDGLFDPLGVNRAEPARSVPILSPPLAVALLAALGVAALIGVAWLRDDGDRGRPRAVSPIERIAPPPAPPPPPPPPPAAVPPAAVPPVALPPGFPDIADQDVEIQNGVRIIRPRRDRGRPVSGQSIPVPPPTTFGVPAANR